MFNIFSAVPSKELFQWQGSQGDFVTFAMLVTRLSGTDFEDPGFPERLHATGQGLLSMISIDIAPHPDFASLYEAVPPSIGLILRMMDCVQNQMAFQEVIENTGVEPSAETQSEQMANVMMGYEMARRLRLLDGNENGKTLPGGYDC